MTFKQTMRKLLANLWHRCASLAHDKLIACHYPSTEHAVWWEEFIVRCEQRALRHAELVPNEPEQQAESHAPFVRYQGPKVDGLECVEWLKKYRNEKHCTLREAKDAWDKRLSAQ